MRNRTAALYLLSLGLAAGAHAAAPGEAYVEVAETARAFAIDPGFDAAGVTGLAMAGAVVQTVSWRDARGLNLLVMTEPPHRRSPVDGPDLADHCALGGCWDAELFVHHYLLEGGRATLVRRVYDFEKGCELDLLAKFLKHSLTITDIDGDGVAEIAFLYAGTCTTDVSPFWLKLIMLEDNVKYALRGTSGLEGLEDIPPEDREFYAAWGQMTVDPAFDAAPQFLEFAKKRWEALKFVDFSD